MKKYFIFCLLMLFPFVVKAEDCSEISNKAYCQGSSCLTSLQSEYNTWNTTGNTGTTCIKVIAKYDGTNRTYLSGKNPEENYKCSNGKSVVAERIASALPLEESASECSSEVCYVPEIWKMECGNSSNISNNNNSSNVSNGSNSNLESNNSSVSDDVSTNDKGQITGTTDASETGVFSYFIVLFLMVIVSYIVLIISKKKNIFKSI